MITRFARRTGAEKTGFIGIAHIGGDTMEEF
jgi:hypothetical protein